MTRLFENDPAYWGSSRPRVLVTSSYGTDTHVNSGRGVGWRPLFEIDGGRPGARVTAVGLEHDMVQLRRCLYALRR